MTMTEEEKIKEEIAFTDYWFTELGKTTTPTFADAIEWAEKRQRNIDVDKACAWLRAHLPRVLDRYYPDNKDECVTDVLNEDMREDFRKAMMED